MARIMQTGGRTFLVEFGNEISQEMNRQVIRFTQLLEQAQTRGILDILPTYRSVLITYDPAILPAGALQKQLQELLQAAEDVRAEDGKKHIIEIPCCYGGEYGPDLEGMSKALGLTEEEIIRIHSEVLYPVYMMGFLPGFSYLGGLDERIHMPRLASPRKCIPTGSVGIGGSQTGIYPLESPGGWQLIGRTPLTLYDPARKEPVLLKAGDYVRFVPITEEEFLRKREDERVISLEQTKGNPYIAEESGMAGKSGAADKQGAAGKSGSAGKPGIAGKTNIAGQPRTEVDCKPVFLLEEAGPLTTIQDGGRYGHMKSGITECGAMDREAMELANLLVGNQKDAAVLECTFMGPKIRFLQPCCIAVTGADMKATLSGMPLPLNKKIEAWAGEELVLTNAKNGIRTYIAFRGGIDVPKVMGSRSTDQKAKLGGLSGRKLEAGDGFSTGQDRRSFWEKAGLSVRSRRRQAEQRTAKLAAAQAGGEAIMVRAYPGPQADYFPQEELRHFTEITYTVSMQADRMGIRLEGEALCSRNGTDIISDGIAFGSVQVPANGQPIVLMADHQTTGGYAKIANVIEEDLPLLAQVRPGDKVRFVWALESGMR